MWTGTLSLFSIFLFSNSYATDWSNHPNIDLLPPQNECGRAGYAGAAAGLDHTGKSNNSTLGAFPSVALLGYEEQGQTKYRCLGALISKRHVLTTYQCITNWMGLPFVVRLGSVNASHSTTNCVNDVCWPPQDVNISDITINAHKKNHWRNDIVLIHLASDVTFNEFVQPVCLPLGSEETRDLEDYTTYVFAWHDQPNYYRPHYYGGRPYRKGGAAANNAGVESDGVATTESTQTTEAPCRRRSCKRRQELGELHYVADIITDGAECRSQFAMGIDCSDCAYSLKTGICTEMDPEENNNCERTTGSPLLYTIPPLEDLKGDTVDDAVFYLAGLMLQPQSYCYQSSPAISTAVAPLIPWILDHLNMCHK